MKKANKILWGVVLLIAGVLFALNALGVTNIDVFFDGWWTLFLIIPCAIGLVTDRDKTGNAIGLCIGVLLLLGCQKIVPFDLIWKLIVPVVIILIGLKMILGGLFGEKKSAEVKRKMKERGKLPKNYCAIFSGQDVKFDGEVFEGAEVNAVFGGVELDLTNAIFEQDCVIDASAIFGGVDIILPDHVRIKTNATSLFGGMSNKKEKMAATNTADASVTVYINGTCMFGGVDIQ